MLEAGGHAVYVPHEVTWEHERVAPDRLGDAQFHEIGHIRELPAVLETLDAAVENG